MSAKLAALGPLEMKVLGLLRGPHGTTVAEMKAQLGDGGDDLAYTTVLTVLGRLYGKGYVGRRKEGRHFAYFIDDQRQTLRQRLFAKVHTSLFSSERLRPILALLEPTAGLSDQELRELKRAVDLRVKGLNKRSS